MRSALLCLACSLAFCFSLRAQDPNATVSGRVLDPSGAVVPGTQVRVINDATNIEYSAVTNDAGIYSIPSVSPGKYHIQVSKSGFKNMVKPDVLLHVQDGLTINFTLEIGAASESVTVEGGAPLINTESGSVGTVIDRNFVESLPLNGRSFNTLLQLTPGVVITPVNAGGGTNPSPGQFSISGQRTTANNFTIDGVSANFGATATPSVGDSGTGSSQAFSALGGTSSLVSVEALQEFRIITSSFAPEFGKSPGGQIVLTTRPGTNDFHGGIYDYFRNTVMDANDWFTNAIGQARAPEHHNDFGGFLGGPIFRDKTFFFFSYEGARLRLPNSMVTQVPSLDARKTAPTNVAPYLNAYPLPNGPVSPDDTTAQFTGVFSNRATLNATSLRVDHVFNDKFSMFARYNYAPSEIVNRVYAMTTLESTTANTQTLTVGLNMLLSHTLSNSVRGNYSTQESHLTRSLDSFQGGTPPAPSLFLGSLSAANSYFAFNGLDTDYYAAGPLGRNDTKQVNFVDDLSWVVGRHQFKFGADDRTILLDVRPYRDSLGFISPSVQNFLTTGAVTVASASFTPSALTIQSLSLYAQDTWKLNSRLTMTYGVRWELAPAPSTRNGTILASWLNVNDPAKLSLAPSGTPLWHTTYRNFAPRLGFAYSLAQSGDFVLRAGVGTFYDIGVGAGEAATFFPNKGSKVTGGVVVPFTDASPYLPTVSLNPPYPNVEAISPDLNLPRSYQWNVALEKSFGGEQALSLTYVGQRGRDLLRQSALYQPNPDFNGVFLLTNNEAFSNYNSLQVQYRRPLSRGLQALLNYAWSHSLDNSSNDVVTGLSNTVLSAASDYASSSFDVRHSFSGALTYSVPNAHLPQGLAIITNNWSIDTVIIARTGFPFNGVVYGSSPDPSGYATSRPDLVPGQPLWISDPTAPGGKSLNPNAFSVPSTSRQGTEGRNDIPGFGLTQVDLSLERTFPIRERLKLQFRADAFNVLNHPNFLNPPALVEYGAPYLSSMQMLNQGLGGLNPLFQEGGPRSLQLSLKLQF
jgi:hypothetical protein